MIEGIIFEALEKPKRTSKGIIARCPACAASGEDKSATNLFIGDRGFCCAKYKGDKEHSKVIFQFLKNGVLSDDYSISTTTQEIIRCPKVWSNEFLDKLYPIDEYWNNRGISSETLRLFKGGFLPNGTYELSNRYVFPILNKSNQIVGWAGRKTTNGGNSPRWKLKGDKNSWVYPALSIPNIKETGYVYLVEGISDVLYLYEHGYKNCLCLFGTVILPELFKELIKLTNTKIVLALNNEVENNSIGNNAAEKIKKNLLNFFDEDRIIIKLPTKKDFAEMSKEELEIYFNEPIKNTTT